jgi:hypothetical protein
MSLHNTDTHFFGKQEGERILFVARPHKIALIFKLVKIYTIALAVFVALTVLGTQLLSLGIFIIVGTILALIIAIFGTKIVTDYQKRDVAYITDRRLVHFEPTTLVATNPRSLTWDEVVKVKTYPPNFIWKQMAIGTVEIHARSTFKTYGETPLGTVTADDIEINDIYFYKDLGNYIDKILFIYKQRPKEMDDIRPFISKPKGERY